VEFSGHQSLVEQTAYPRREVLALDSDVAVLSLEWQLSHLDSILPMTPVSTIAEAAARRFNRNARVSYVTGELETACADRQ
jgi:hypothetical protein